MWTAQNRAFWKTKYIWKEWGAIFHSYLFLQKLARALKNFLKCCCLPQNLQTLRVTQMHLRPVSLLKQSSNQSEEHLQLSSSNKERSRAVCLSFPEILLHQFASWRISLANQSKR